MTDPIFFHARVCEGRVSYGVGGKYPKQGEQVMHECYIDVLVWIREREGLY